MPARTAILVVNGFDRVGLWGTKFDAADALRYPWIDLCLREVQRRSSGSDHEVFVWDNSQVAQLREAITARGARLLPSDEDLDAARDRRGTDELVQRLCLRHEKALETLWSTVDDTFEFLITLDSDAFPVADGWIEHLQRNLADTSLTGVWRDEMPDALGPFVHPSGMCIRTERLRQIAAPFALAGVQSIGQQITQEILLSGERIMPVRRSNRRNAHFLMGGIYGDVIYHHGAGSRWPLFRMTEGEERDRRTYERLRELVFKDVDLLMAALRGERDDDLGLEWQRVEPRSWTSARWGGPGFREPAEAGALAPGFDPEVLGSQPPPVENPAGWLDQLPEGLAGHAAILRLMVEYAARDARVRALQVQGSLGRGTADRHSDLDVGAMVSDDSWPAIAQDVPAIVRRLGDVVDDYYEFQPSPVSPQVLRVWALFRDGIQLDLLIVPAATVLGSGPDGRALYDLDGLLIRTDHPMRLSDPAAAARWSFIAWGALSETAKNVARDQPVAAVEWLNPARQATISCWAAAHGLEYAGYANVVATKLGVSCPWPDGLEKTYPEPSASSVACAALELARLQARADALLAERLRIPPRPMGSWVISQLEQLQGELPDPGNPEGRRSRGDKRPASARRSRPPRAAPRAR